VQANGTKTASVYCSLASAYTQTRSAVCSPASAYTQTRRAVYSPASAYAHTRGAVCSPASAYSKRGARIWLVALTPLPPSPASGRGGNARLPSPTLWERGWG
jgi:hypothetical protein